MAVKRVKGARKPGGKKPAKAIKKAVKARPAKRKPARKAKPVKAKPEKKQVRKPGKLPKKAFKAKRAKKPVRMLAKGRPKKPVKKIAKKPVRKQATKKQVKRPRAENPKTVALKGPAKRASALQNLPLIKGGLSQEEIALKVLDVYFSEVARRGLKRRLSLDEVINAYFYALLRVKRKAIGIEEVKKAALRD